MSPLLTAADHSLHCGSNDVAVAAPVGSSCSLCLFSASFDRQHRHSSVQTWMISKKTTFLSHAESQCTSFAAQTQNIALTTQCTTGHLCSTRADAPAARVEGAVRLQERHRTPVTSRFKLFLVSVEVIRWHKLTSFRLCFTGGIGHPSCCWAAVTTARRWTCGLWAASWGSS